MSIWFSAGYAIAGAATELTAGAASRKSNFTTVLLLSAPAALAVAVVAVIVSPGRASIGSIGWGILAGIVGGAALPVAFHALAIGSIGVVASVIACTSTIALGLAGIITDGSPSGGVWVGMALCLAAILFLGQKSRPSASLQSSALHNSRASESRAVPPLAVVLAMIAGLGYAGFTLIMSFARRDDGGPTALVAARAAVLVVAVALPLITGPPRRPTVGVAAYSLSAGVLDVSGNLFLLAALATTPLITVAIVGATSPCIAALGAAILLRERLNGWQLTGLALAAGGAVLATTT